MFRYEELSTLRKLILFKKLIASSIKVVSGAIASFVTKAAGKAISVLDSIEPIQDLHGYDKPWSGGSGKNKANCADISAPSISNTPYNVGLGSASYVVSFDIVNAVRGILSNTSFLNIISGGANKYYTGETILKVSDNSTLNSAGANINGRYYCTVSNKAIDSLVFFWRSNTYATLTSGAVKNIMVEVGTTPSAYSPYSNICPISGHTEVVTSRCGKNLLVSIYSGGINNNTGEEETATNGICNFIKVNGATQYTVSGSTIGNNSIRIFEYDEYKHFIATYTSSSANNASTFTTGASTSYVRLKASIGVLVPNGQYLFETGTTATAYEPYNGTSYTTDLGRTVYGGTLDVVSGLLTVERGYIASYNGETLPSTWISDRDEYVSGTTPTIGAEVVYELATPQTIQLAPQEVDLLKGQNNLWCDCGEIQVTYKG